MKSLKEIENDNKAPVVPTPRFKTVAPDMVTGLLNQFDYKPYRYTASPAPQNPASDDFTQVEQWKRYRAGTITYGELIAWSIGCGIAVKDTPLPTSASWASNPPKKSHIPAENIKVFLTAPSYCTPPSTNGCAVADIAVKIGMRYPYRGEPMKDSIKKLLSRIVEIMQEEEYASLCTKAEADCKMEQFDE